MKLLVTIGGTVEPIDAVRYLGNRSSGRMGVAIATAALEAGHEVFAVCGSKMVTIPEGVEVIPVKTTRAMHDAVLRHWPEHDVLVMAAAVADFRPKVVSETKLRRRGATTLELEPTEDILAAAGARKQPQQRIVGFSLDAVDEAGLTRARDKIVRKNCDLLVLNPLRTMEADDVDAVLLWPDGRRQDVAATDKSTFARRLLAELDALR